MEISPRKNDMEEEVELLERMMDRFNDDESEEDDKSLLLFLDVVDRLSQLCTSTVISSQEFHQISSVLEKAMFLLEKRICSLLDQEPKYKPPNKSFSFRSRSRSTLPVNFDTHSPRPTQRDHPTQDPFSFSPQKISILNKISASMISAGYHIECYMAFAYFRRIAFKTTLQNLGYGNTKMEDFYKMPWESLGDEIATWNQIVCHCTSELFKAERRLYESIFPNQPSVTQKLFSDLARHVIIHLLNFAQGAVLTKWTTEKLFKFLDMYETLSEEVLQRSYPESFAKELAYETNTAKERIVEAIVAMFCDLKNSIENDNQRVPVPNGAVHPLTRYVMNYLKYACEYKNTLEQVFEEGGVEGEGEMRDESKKEKFMEVEEVEDVERRKKSGFGVQLMSIMELLDENVERKSKLYKDHALRYFFLMNNGRYIVQKVKGCGELHELMGDDWCRRRQSGLRLYHKSYQRETWNRVLQCLNQEGLQGSRNKVSKQLVKERFKSFNGMLEEIHKCQSCWMVSDDQLQSELRVSVSSLVIPAYRSFVGRFKHHLESTRHIDSGVTGFINTHVHSSQQLARGIADDVDLMTWLHHRIWPYESNMTEHDSYLSTLLCGIELIHSGVTCFAEAGGQHVSGMARAVSLLGLRACLTQSTMDSGHGLPPSWATRTTDHCIQSQKDNYDKYHNTAQGRIRIWFGVRQIMNSTPSLLIQTRDAATQLKTGIHMHVAEIPYENQLVRDVHKVDHGTVTYLDKIDFLQSNLLAAHSVWIDDNEISLLSRAGVKVSHCPAAAMRMLGFAPVREMLDAGICVSLGTDGAPSNNRMSIVDEMYLASLINKGREVYANGTTDPTALPAETILRMVTVNGAKSVLWDDELGSLEVGKKADIVVVNPSSWPMVPVHDCISSIVYCMRSENVVSVMCNGLWIMKNKKIIHVDEEEVILKAKEASVDLLKRAGITLPTRMNII